MRHRFLVLPLVLAFVAGSTVACTPDDDDDAPATSIPSDASGNLVLVTHAGEVDSDVRLPGDQVSYRVHYVNGGSVAAELVVTAEFDPGLEEVTAASDGTVDVDARAINWNIGSVPAGAAGSVDFAGVVGQVETLAAEATVRVAEATHPAGSVEIDVCRRPRDGWVPFRNDANEGDAPLELIKAETPSGSTIRFDIPGMYAHEVAVDGVAYHRFAIPGQGTLQSVGEPELPIIGALVEIPYGVDIGIEVVQQETVDLSCYNAYPAQPPLIRQDFPYLDEEEPEFQLESATYLGAGYFPGDLTHVEIEDIGVIRGHRVAFVKIHPVQFDPVTHQLQGFSMLEIELVYDQPAQLASIASELVSPAFEEMLAASLVNYHQPDRYAQDERQKDKDEGADYLILTDSTFWNENDSTNPIVEFRQWKRQKGYSVRVVDVTNLSGGNTAASIRTYIENAYETWAPAPTYVLVVGDSDFVATDYQTDHWYHDSDIGSDQHYVTVDGTDYFPDLFIGRVSVDTLAQAEDVFDKIIEYEQNPPAQAAFYDDAALVMLFEDTNSDGRENETFRIVEFAESIEDHLDNLGYGPEQIYDESGTFATGPQRYEDNTNLPANLTTAGGFPWAATTADITAAIDAGTFLTVFDGHGARDAWDRPRFDNGDVGGLNNGALTPVVLSLACQTGWFDNETDANDTNAAPGVQPTANGDESLGEAFLREPGNGAVGFIGSTRVSWDNNDFMMLGMAQALWPDFDPNPPLRTYTLPDIATSPLSRLGQINTFSKIYMANVYSHDFNRESSFEMYHVFGDPEMPVWTQEPDRLSVTHPAAIGSSGTQDFVVRVESGTDGTGVHGAVVSLTGTSDPIAVQMTNPDGLTRFQLQPTTTDLTITVTGRNRRPYIGTITISDNGASITATPENNIAGSTFAVDGVDFATGELVDVAFGGQPPTTVQADANGDFSGVSVAVPAGHGLGPANVSAVGRSSARAAADVFIVRTANPIDLFTYSQWANDTWALHNGDNPTWNNPEIELSDAASGNSVASNNLNVGTTYKISATFHNDTTFEAEDAVVTFKWANFGVGQPDRVWEEIGTVEIDLAGNGTAIAEFDWAPPSTGHLCVLAEIHHIEDIELENNRGQENLHVGEAASPAEVAFMVWNPTKEPAMVHFELRQLVNPDQPDAMWPGVIIHPDPQLLPAGASTRAVVSIDPDLVDIPEGTEAEFALTAWIGPMLIGGVNLTIVNG